MRGLIDFAGRPAVKAIVERAAAITSVQGVIAEYQPLWHLLRHVDDEEALMHWRPPLWRYPDLLMPPEISPGLGLPDEVVWRRWGKVHGGDPFRLRICLLMGGTDEASRLPEIDALGVPLAYERRPIARLTTSRALRARADSEEGTIGGAVRSAAGDLLGITCSHVVAASPSILVEDEGAPFLPRLVAAISGGARAPVAGECVGKTNLVALGADGTCNPYGANDHSNELDVALVKADFTGLPVFQVSGAPAPRASLTSGVAAKVLAIGGERTAEIGGLALYYSLRGPSENYCFRNLFEVLAPRHRPKVIGPGDSGAWVLRHGPEGDEWVGLAVGSDDLRGFAIFAESVHSWGKNEGLL